MKREYETRKAEEGGRSRVLGGIGAAKRKHVSWKEARGGNRQRKKRKRRQRHRSRIESISKAPTKNDDEMAVMTANSRLKAPKKEMSSASFPPFFRRKMALTI